MFEEQSGIYEKLWNDATSAFEHGQEEIDPHLSGKTHDLRRGVTLILRPSLSVRGTVKDYLDRIARVFPEQYFYRPEEFHITVLSIISGTESWRKEMRRLVFYRAIISNVLARHYSFKISFRGVTASPGSVIIQGFPMCDELTRIRDSLRRAFLREGFGSLLDHRYKVRAAHITVMRLRKPIADRERLVSLLKDGRQLKFGETEVDDLELIWGDWYATANKVRTLQKYRLSVHP